MATGVILWSTYSTGSVEEVAAIFGREYFTQPERLIDKKTLKTIEQTAGKIVAQFKLKGGIRTYQLTGLAPGNWQVEVVENPA